MSHVVNMCPLTKPDGGIVAFHSADNVTVTWLGS